MAYVKSNDPGGKLPGWGWAPGLRGYVKSNDPGGKLPGWGWAPGLRGLDGGLRKLVFGGLGCSGKCGGCSMRGKCLGRLGQDDSGDLFLNSFSAPTPSVTVPTGYGYGPSQSGAVALYPVGVGSDGPYATPQDLPVLTSNGQVTGASSPTYSVYNNPSSSPLTTGGSLITTAASATSPLGGITTTEVLLAGAALLAVVLVSQSGGKRRR